MLPFSKALSALVLSSFLGIVPVLASVESDQILSGTELLYGYRNQYILRGRNVGKSVVEGQFSSGLALNSFWDMNFSGYAYQGLSGATFQQVGGYLEFVWHKTEHWDFTLFSSANYYNNTEFKTGIEWGGKATYTWNDHWSAQIQALYDTGQQGTYVQGKVSYFLSLSDDTALKAETGLGGGYDYFEVRGINELFGRISLPLRVSPRWVIEPFLGVSLQGGSQDTGARLYAGAWASFIF